MSRRAQPPSRAAARSFAAVVLRFLQRRAALPLVREVLRHWLRERRTLRQGVLALAICIGVTLVAGVILGAMETLLEEVPGLLILAPAAIGMRGAIFGALGARLGTGMLTGQFELSVRRRSFLGQNVEAAALLTVVTAALLAVVAVVVAGLFGVRTRSPLDLVVVSMTGAVLASVVVLAVVLLIARAAERWRWDLDAIGTPIISATADISTLPALAAGTLLLDRGAVTVVAGAGSFVLAGVALVAGLRGPGAGATKEGDVKPTQTRRAPAPATGPTRIVRESLPVLVYASVMGILAGTVLETRLDTLVSSPALLVAIPPFIASSGAIGGILSARLSSALHLGLVEPRALPQRSAVLEGSLSVFFALLGYVAVGALTEVAAVGAGFASPGTGRLIAIALIGGLLAVTILFVVGYYAATSSYRFGLDPDNVAIPVVTSSMDFFGILCLVAAISLVGTS